MTLALALTGAAASASAQEYSAASGMAFGVKVAAEPTAVDGALAVPSFLVGYRQANMTVGLGAGMSGITAEAEGSGFTGLIFQFAPTIQYDLWTSSDGKVGAGVVASVGYGWASGTLKDEVYDYDPVTGQDIITTRESETTASLIPVSAGFGGDYFLHPNFALGTEAGYRGTFVFGVEASGREIDLSLGRHGFYGALRATLVLGS